ncbi:MAG: NAD-dependent epimerase/dehydratase family protein [Chitinophagaceae bacterium]|nr:NAD-dependent epimerase/dehydratase family protein [Chitinophagaceae bacterium]
MKIVVIGGTGHIGTYLVPRLVKAGHEVICVSRGQRNPYSTDPAWKAVEQITIDRDASEEHDLFGAQIKALKGDVVIDLICFTPQSAAQLAKALIDQVQHFIHCGTMWVHGYSEQVPTVETQERKPFGEYGINKAKIEAYLLSLNRQNAFPVTILHPGHITGPGWLPINPAGNLNPEVFIRLAKGEAITLPNIGMETLHHVHADDVAQSFEKAIEHRKKAVGESFHIVSEQALTLKGYATAVAKWFGKDANLHFLPWEEWKKTVSEREAGLTWDHIAHSPVGSIEKAKQLLKYRPQYSSLQAIREAVTHFFEKEGMY